MTASYSNDWPLYRSAVYLRGRGIDFGGTNRPVFDPRANEMEKYCVTVNPAKPAQAAVCADKLDVLAPGIWDYVYVRRLLEAVPNEKATLGELVSKIKTGGHIIFDLFTDSSGPGVLRQLTPDSIKALLPTVGNWQQKTEIVRDQRFLQIFKKLPGHAGTLKPIKPIPSKRVCIARYGAFGDMIMLTPLVRKFKEDGYHVTVNCAMYSSAVLDYNPNVDNVLPQERDVIYNPDLGQYWKEWEQEYDKYINLSESIEGKLLVVEGRHEFFTSSAYRRARSGNINYYDQTMRLGGYPEVTGTRGELFFNRDERKRAEQTRKDLGNTFLVIWALNGSSHHKRYPLMEPVLREWFNQHPDTIVMTVGDVNSATYEFDHPNVMRCAGKTPIRDIMCLTKYADCIIGPESAILNTAGCFDTPKITFLSHSNHTNLCKYWTNDYCLTPDPTVAPCYPCHQLHYSKESCPLSAIVHDQTGTTIAEGPSCAMGAISGESLLARLSEVYQKRQSIQ